MIATHQVKTADKNTIGFMIDNVFYTNNYIRQNIQYIDNLFLQEQEILTSDEQLPELNYKKDIIDKKCEKLIKENPFFREIQNDLQEWKADKLHKFFSWREQGRLEKQLNY